MMVDVAITMCTYRILAPSALLSYHLMKSDGPCMIVFGQFDATHGQVLVVVDVLGERHFLSCPPPWDMRSSNANQPSFAPSRR